MELDVLTFRADASPQIGAGHVLRCVAVAQAWQRRGGRVLCITASLDLALYQRLSAEGFSVVQLAVPPGSGEDVEQTIALARQQQSRCLVVDGYHFGADYQRRIKNAGLRLLVVDDYGHARHYYADFVLNQNLHAHVGLYSNRETSTQLLLGTRYILLRQEFLGARASSPRSSVAARNLLVTLGGSDPENVTSTVIKALQQLPDKELEVKIVGGGSNPRLEQLQTVAATSRIPLQLCHSVADVAALMRWADIAVSAAGSTAWELAYMGVPSLLVTVAENQRLIAERLAYAGAAIDLGWHKAITLGDISSTLQTVKNAQEKRQTLARQGQKIVDGHGAARVVMELTGDSLRLRQVQEDDCWVLWEWANDAEVRSVSFSSAPILWPDHVRWFKAKLTDPHCLFFLAINSSDEHVGQVRYDLHGDHAVISVSLDRRQRSKGYGTTLLRLSAQAFFSSSSLTTIHAYVKSGNQASLRTFERAGYMNTGITEIEGQRATRLTLTKNTAVEDGNDGSMHEQ